MKIRRGWMGGLLGLAALLAGTADASALCIVCSASVRLDESLAGCLAQRSDAERQKLAAQKAGFVIVDLSDCQGRGGLPTGGDAPAAVLDTQFVADRDSLDCLLGQIAALDDTALTPSHVFDLTAGCPAP